MTDAERHDAAPGRPEPRVHAFRLVPEGPRPNDVALYLDDLRLAAVTDFAVSAAADEPYARVRLEMAVRLAPSPPEAAPATAAPPAAPSFDPERQRFGAPPSHASQASHASP